MSVYIKDMEIPTTCGNCWFCHAVSNEKWHCRLTGKSFASYSVGWGDEKNTGENGQHPYIRRDDCPLIEVPEPHGRLGDLDALPWYLANTSVKYATYEDWEMLCDAIAAAPTVIPASKEG